MLMTLIQKEILHHILSIRFVALLVMCVLLIPLTLSINYRKYNQNLVNYQEAVKRAQTEAKENPPNAQDPNTEVSKLFPQAYASERLRKRFRGGTADLSWNDA